MKKPGSDCPRMTALKDSVIFYRLHQKVMLATSVRQRRVGTFEEREKIIRYNNPLTSLQFYEPVK